MTNIYMQISVWYVDLYRLTGKYPGQVKLGNMGNLFGGLWETLDSFCSACNRLHSHQ